VVYPGINTGPSPTQNPDLDDGAEHTLGKSDDDTSHEMMGGVTDTPEGHAAIQVDVDRLEKWADRNLVSSAKYQVLCSTPCTSIRWEVALQKRP